VSNAEAGIAEKDTVFGGKGAMLVSGLSSVRRSTFSFKLWNALLSGGVTGLIREIGPSIRFNG
jgi:hypothetical protein